MSFTKIQQIPSTEEIIKELPLPDKLAKGKAKRDLEIKDVLTGKSNKFLLIIGPCSAHDENAVYDYVNRLAEIQEKVKDKILIIPRIYTNKPRTTGEGYKGMAHQPDLDKKPNIVEGIKAIRRMHIKSIADSGLPAADEMLYPENYPYLEDLLSYVAVGARSVENQQHRLTCSGLDIPVGMKNPTSGDIGVMLNSVKAAQIDHTFFYKNWEVKTDGNPLAHTILRGAVNQYNRMIPNYHYEDLRQLSELYEARSLANPAVIVDANHANSNKQYMEQSRIVKEVVHSMKKSKEIKKIVKGVMVESFIEDGNQPVNGTVYGKSITDPCIGWLGSVQLIMDLADNV